MAINKIRISNFKSFKDLEIKLGNFNVLIGANASGKSNFIQIFKFLRDITKDGLDNAISMQGGIGYLRNINIGSSKNFSLEVVSDQKYLSIGARTKEKDVFVGISVSETIYRFGMEFKKKGLGFEIAEDKLTQKGNYVTLKMQKKKPKEKILGPAEVTHSHVNGKVNASLKYPEGVSIKGEDMFLSLWKLEPKTPLIEVLPRIILSPLFRNISIYDFDPKLPKMSARLAGKSELEEDGNNLAIVLKNVIGNKDRERKFLNLVKDLLPFVKKLGIEKFAGKFFLLKLQESFFKDKYVPAFLISDGTINITALIIALYFEKKRLTIIEEPERNIHPYLISKVVEMMKEASQKKQIIVTTHNPEMIKHVDLEDILLISRNKDGFSTISRPSEKEEVKTFLENEIGVEELFVQDLLEV